MEFYTLFSFYRNGVWFAVHGTGGALKVYQAKDSSIEPLVSVLQGSCRNLECVESRYEDVDGLSVLSWDTDEDEIYYLLVRGTDNTRGNFEIIIKSDESAPGHAEELAESEQPEYMEPPLEPPVNDFCDSAIELAVDGSVVHGSTENATSYLDDVGACHNQGAFDAGVWFLVRGSGKPMQASTTEKSDADAFISVYSGDCENLFCISDTKGDTTSKTSFTWDTMEGDSYFLLVQGNYGKTGAFELVVQDAPLPLEVANDKCQGALGPIPTNSTLWAGTTVGATIDMDGVGSCYAANATG
jgi:hypothetical protein